MNNHKGHLKKEERMEIYLLLKKGYSRRDIADALGRDHTVILREIERNSSGERYDPHRAQDKARIRRRYSKYQGMKINECPELKRYVKEKLEAGWTPEQIAGRLKEKDTPLLFVSHAGIYKWLYSAHGQAYCQYLPSRRCRKRKRKEKKAGREMIPNRVGIECRPGAVNDRREYGHYEGDTVVSGRRHKTKTNLKVITERGARYARLRKAWDMKPETNNRAVRDMMEDLLKKTMTLDNGIENKEHEELAEALDIDVYFCDPYSSWQKGGVENLNRRIRRFIPKGASLDDYTEEDIAGIEYILNNTPRKCLNYKTPHEVMLENHLFLNPKTPRVVHLRA